MVPAGPCHCGTPQWTLEGVQALSPPATARFADEQEGRRRMAVNLRQAPPEAVAHLPIDHFDGLDSFEDLPPSDAAFAISGREQMTSISTLDRNGMRRIVAG
jgi:hypothetical protein